MESNTIKTHLLKMSIGDLPSYLPYIASMHIQTDTHACTYEHACTYRCTHAHIQCMDTHACTYTSYKYTPHTDVHIHLTCLTHTPSSPLSPSSTHLFSIALVGMLHVGVFLMLLLSGERNFGVRLNKPYTQKMALQDIPKFSGTHADLLFLVRSCDIIYHHHCCITMM